MRALAALIATLISSCGTKDPCAGVVPQTLPIAVDVAPAPFDRVPFQDAFVGDGNGSIAFFSSLTSDPQENYSAYVYDNGGQLIRSFEGRSADSSRPHPLFQREGFQVLEGNTASFAWLATYSGSGSLISKTTVTPGEELVSAIDPSSGTLVLVRRYIQGAPKALTYPWEIFARQFDQQGMPRGPERLIATDPLGQFSVGGLAGAVTATGWIFVVWTTYHPDPSPRSADVQGRWIAPDGRLSVPIALGTNGVSSPLDVEPLAGGGIALATTVPPWPYTEYRWVAQLHDGASAPAPAGWLESFRETRLATVRGGRAHALMNGAPFLAADQCQSNVPVTLMSIEGKRCGTLSLPALLDSTLACVKTISSAAVARDGTVVLRTFEYGTDSAGNTQLRSLARWWPQLLR